MLVKVGDTVERGQAIASMGSSGGSYNKHLHFELRTNPGNRETSINVNPTNASQNKGLVNYSTTGYKPVQSATVAESTYKLDNDGYKMYMIKDSAAKSTIGASNSTSNTNFDFEIIKDFAKLMRVCSVVYCISVFSRPKAQLTDKYSRRKICLCRQFVNL